MAGALLAAASSAQQPPTPVTLPGVLEAARDNLDVSLARRALAAAQADVVTADHGPAPVVSAKAASIDLQNGVGGGNLLRDKRIDKSLGIDWTWERGNKRGLRTRAAKFSAGAAQADLQEAQVQQQLAAAAAYYDLMAAQERIAHVEAIARSAADLSATAQRRVGAGDLSRQEALRIEIEAQRAGSEVRSAQADRQKAAAAVSLLTGLPQPFTLVTDWPALDAAISAMPDPEQRSDVRAAQQRLEASRAALDGAQAMRRADVMLGASIDHFPGTSTRQLEVRLQMPLIGVLGSYGFEGEVGRARVLVAQAQDQLDKTQRAAAADSQRLQQELQVSATRARTYQEAIVPRARQVASMAELAYRQRAMSLADLIEARRTLRTALLEDVVSRADHARALAAWQLRAAAGPF